MKSSLKRGKIIGGSVPGKDQEELKALAEEKVPGINCFVVPAGQ